MTPRNLIIDLEGLTLTQEEKELLQHPVVAGVILFARNYASPDQLRSLTATIKCVRSPIMITADQEGGRVQRFKSGFTLLPSMRHWGERFIQDPGLTKQQLIHMTNTMVDELHAVGINANLVPVLDVDHAVSEVIGERSFHSDPDIIIELANSMIETMHAKGMPATGKHFPGHGGVSADSHLSLPVDSRKRDEIWCSDLTPFAKLAGKLDAIMPAHVIYSKLDDKPAGFSRFWLQTVLRNELKFKGIIVSDDLTMAGASAFGSYEERAHLALDAGCDLLTVCNNRAGTLEVLQALEKYPDSQFNIKAQLKINDYISYLS